MLLPHVGGHPGIFDIPYFKMYVLRTRTNPNTPRAPATQPYPYALHVYF